MMDHPPKKAMNKLKATRRLIQWAIELSEFDIRYQPRNAIKAQVLSDFITEFTLSHGNLDEGNEAKVWVVHVVGSSTLYVEGIGVVLKSPEGDKLKYATRLHYQTTNNEVYEALLKGLKLANSLGVDVTTPPQLCRYCLIWDPYPSWFYSSPKHTIVGENASTH